MTAVSQRIQRKRTKGWRMPPGTIYVGRPSKWGNPYFVHSAEILLHPDGRDWYCPTKGGARLAAVDFYEADLPDGLLAFTVEDVVRELVGHDLACWCPLDAPCHGDVLLKLANS